MKNFVKSFNVLMILFSSLSFITSCNKNIIIKFDALKGGIINISNNQYYELKIKKGSNYETVSKDITASMNNYSFKYWVLENSDQEIAKDYIFNEDTTLFASYELTEYKDYIKKFPGYIWGEEQWKKDKKEGKLEFNLTIYNNFNSDDYILNVNKGQYISKSSFSPLLGYKIDSWYSDDDYESEIEDNFTAFEPTNIYTKCTIDEHELPVFNIETENHQPIISKEDYVKAKISLSNCKDDDYEFSDADLNIRGRGNSSWSFPKKPYRLKFEKKRSMFGSRNKFKNWVLSPSYADKSLVRNYIAYKISSALDDTKFAPMQQLVDVYLNDEYLGVYLFTDLIEANKGRVDIDEDLDPETGNNGYLLERNSETRLIDKVIDQDYFKIKGEVFEIKSPDTESKEYLQIKDIEINFIKTYISNLFLAFDNCDYNKISSLINVDTFIDGYIVQELFGNTDSYCWSTFFYKNKDEKLCYGPVWDFDIGGGNSNYGLGTEESCPPDKSLWTGNVCYFFNSLLKCSPFVSLLKNKLNKYEERILEILELLNINNEKNIYNLNKNCFDRNFIKWNIMGSYIWPEPKSVYEISLVSEQLLYLYNWLKIRYQFIKTYFSIN